MNARVPTFTDADKNPIPAREAFNRLLTSAAAGSAPAMLNVAEFYGQGWGVKQNFTERFRWHQKAGEAGDPRGTYQAALSLELGLGVTADQSAARAGLVKAAAAGLPEAHLKLGRELLNGPGADPVKAVAHLEKALEAGLPLAANILGLLYLQGAGNLAADPEKARQVLQKGADLADPEALKNLAVMHKEGWGGAPDPAEALKWYVAAREAGWQGGDDILTALKTELDAETAEAAEAEARAWLEGKKAPGRNPPAE
jgi:TPR repeat protein